MEENSITGEACNDPKLKKGGFKASLFIFAFASLGNMAFVANLVSLAFYFNMQLHFDVSSSANTLTNLMGSAFLLSVIIGFVSDSYISRFNTILIFGAFELLGLVLITVQAHYPNLQPKPCDQPSCVRGYDAVIFYISLCLLAFGTGGVWGVLPAFGADQFDQNHHPKKANKALGSYFNWFMLSNEVGAIIGVTIIVWVGSEKGWWKGFLISLLVTFFGLFLLAIGKHSYCLHSPGHHSPMLRFVQVIVVAIKNRNLNLPESSEQLYDNYESVEKLPFIHHTNQFRSLDKAAMLPSNKEPTPWTICTVTQIEEVKILTRMLPIVFSTIILNTCLAQLQTYSVQQCYYMNRKLGSFQIPAPSISAIPLFVMSILIPVYEFIFVPISRKITNHPSGITQLQRVGVGLVLSVISMAVAALVEVRRKNQSVINPKKPIHVSWITIQYSIFGICDMFTLVGLLEFFNKEAPIGMKSLSTSFAFLSLSIGYFLSSIFVETINSVTRRIGHNKQGWLEGKDLDMYKLNYFYWFLAIISCLNFFNYLYWASWYKYKQEDDVYGMKKEISTAKNEDDETFKGTSNGAEDEEPIADRN